MGFCREGLLGAILFKAAVLDMLAMLSETENLQLAPNEYSVSFRGGWEVPLRKLFRDSTGCNKFLQSIESTSTEQYCQFRESNGTAALP